MLLDCLSAHFNFELPSLKLERNFQRLVQYRDWFREVLGGLRQDLHDIGNLREDLTQDYMNEKLSGGMLVDLGGGEETMIELAQKYGVKLYICIDAQIELPSNPDGKIFHVVSDRMVGDMRVVAIQCDMIDFLARMRPGLANFVINGIDLSLIEFDDFHAVVAYEVFRNLPKGGIVFGYDSRVLELLDCCLLRLYLWKTKNDQDYDHKTGLLKPVVRTGVCAQRLYEKD